MNLWNVQKTVIYLAIQEIYFRKKYDEFFYLWEIQRFYNIPGFVGT